MNTYYHYPSKTLGTNAAHLVTTLYSQNRPVFHFKEAEKILGSRASASNTLSQLINHGVVMRLISGKFRLVPFELGFESEYLGNPFVVARELALGRRGEIKNKHFISHGSAFDLHQITTQPQLIVYVSSLKMIRPRIIQGTEFRFVKLKTNDAFGIMEMWVDKDQKVFVSDLERTLIDGLKIPAYCGGFTEVAKAFYIKREGIDPQKIIDYTLKLNVGVVNRRLGYLMELYQIGTNIHWEFLKTTITPTYQLLDPDLVADGPYIAKWRLRLNILPEELLTLGGA